MATRKKKSAEATLVTKRQGDVFLVRVDAAPQAEHGVHEMTAGGIEIAEGETSGHTHRLFGAGGKLMHFKATGQRLISVGEDGAMMRVVGGEVGGVARHHPVELTPGLWEVRIQQTWSAERAASERVAD